MLEKRRRPFDITIEDPDKARQAANIAVLFLAALVFVRGFHANPGVAAFMTLFITTSTRLLFEVLIHWNTELPLTDYPQTT